MRRFGITALIGIVYLAGTPSFGQDDAIAAARRFATMHERFSEIDASTRRFEPFPRGIKAVDVAEGGTALVTHSSMGFTVDDVGDGTLRLLRGGRVLGTSRDGAFLVVLDGGGRWGDARDGRIVDGDEMQPVAIPAGVRRAYHADRWYAQCSPTLYALSDGPPQKLTDVTGTLNLVVTETPDGLVLSGVERSTRPPTLRIVRAAAGECAVESIQSRLLMNSPLLLPRADGDVLMVGDRVVPVEWLTRRFPDEATLGGIVEAARTGDEARLRKLLPEVTWFPTDVTHGLVSNLRGLPDESGALRGLLAWLADAQREGTQRLAPARDGADWGPAVAAEVEAALAALEQAEQNIQDLVATRHPFAPGRIAEFVSRSEQFQGGHWLRPPAYPLRVDPDRALVRVRCREPGTGDVWGLAYIGADASVQPVHVEESTLRRTVNRNTYTVPVSAVRDQNGAMLLFVKSVGLARLDGAEPVWLDRSLAVRGMHRLVACDRRGRLYFEQRSPTTGLRHTFMYRIDGVHEPTRRADLFSLTGPGPALDDRDRIWFVSDNVAGAMNWSAEPARPADLDLRAVGAATRDEKNRDAASAVLPLRRRTGAPTLYRLDDDGVLHRVFSNTLLARASLLPGAGGALFIVAEGVAYLVDGDAVYVADDLASLARRHWDAALRLAPERLVPTHDMGREKRPGLLRTGELLWVVDDGTLEVFRDGAPLSFGERLEVRTGAIDDVRVVGPLVDGDAGHVFVTVRHAGAYSHLWATVAGGDIDLVPVDDQIEVESGAQVPINTTLNGRPVVDFARERLLFSTGSQILDLRGPGRATVERGGGRLVFVAADGRLGLEQNPGGRPGTRGPFTIVGPDGREELDFTTSIDAEPVAMDDGGRLVCLGWSGLTWAQCDADGRWRAGEHVTADLPERPVALLGETRSAWYLLCGHRRTLARIPKSASP